ncbi:MAG: TPM domain-containing protein [candidate division WOR-3 bacterium]
MFLFFILSQTFPEPTGFLNDYAHILNQRQKEDLENHLREIENKTSVEIAIAIFDSIGYPIEEYANLLFEKWGIGKKGKDNGILILVSIKERLIRIEVGYGLEEVITDWNS